MTGSVVDPELFDASFLAQLDRLALATKRALAGDLQGERRSPRRGASVEFADFKAYVPGDDFRQIDWNLYARLDRFFLKLFMAEEELTIHFLLDTSRSMDWGQPNKLRYAKRVTGAVGYIALSNLDRVTLTAFGQSGVIEMPLQRTKQGAVPLFRFLQGLQPGSQTDFAEVGRRYARTARNPGPLLLCTDLLDAEWQAGLQALLRRRFEITLLHLLAPEEIEPSIDGDLRLMDAEGGLPVDLTADPDLLTRYYTSLTNWRDEISTFCSSRSIAYVPVTTSLPIETLLLHLMRQRGILH
ncbi:MAG: DUF58 domain-containing protein [Herpetosiphonaceae bacterium]|nr:DUF58 domain-containing protein [Herpetosiphonaceae bacterium]